MSGITPLTGLLHPKQEYISPGVLTGTISDSWDGNHPSPGLPSFSPPLPQPSETTLLCEAREDDAMEYLTRQHIVSILTNHILYQWQLEK